MAQSILQKNGIEPDKVNGTVNMALLTPEDIDNIGKVAPYELASQTGLDFKGVLSDFIVKNALDRFTQNDKLMDALDGHLQLSSFKSSKLSDSFREDNLPSEKNLATQTYPKESIQQQMGNFKVKINAPTKEEMLSLRAKAANGEITPTQSLRLESLVRADVYGAKSILNKAKTYRELKDTNDMITVGRALQRYADMGKQAKPESVVQHLKDMLDEKALQQRRLDIAEKAMNDATKEVDAKTAAAQGMREEDLVKVSQESTKFSKPFADAVKDSLKNFRAIKSAKEIFDKFINCERGFA
jgi:hypothetical protein